VEQLIFIIIALVIAAIRAASKAKEGSNEPPLTPRRPRPPAESDAERQRRFLEAVGLPPGAQLPPPVRPRPGAAGPLPPIPPHSAAGPVRRIYTGVPQKAAPAPPAPAIRRIPPASPPLAPAPVTPLVQTVTIAPAAPVTPITAAIQAAAASHKAATPYGPAAQASTRASTLLLRLRDPDSIRQAIILREILGPPKALQPLAAGPAAPWMGR
jgi:hypothetical protein